MAEWTLEGKVAIVTGGGGSGLGRALALRIARDGAGVVVADVDETGGAETVRRIEEAGGRAAFIRTDVTAERDLEAAVAFAEETFGGLDLLVNNAGGTPKPHFPEAPIAHWSPILDLNLRGPMMAIQHSLPAMERRGGGAVVNIASVAGLGYAHHSSPEYSAAKAGLIRLTATLGLLAERSGVRVNCIVPNGHRGRVSAGEDAAVDRERRARDPAGAITGEQEDRLDDVGRIAVAS